MTRARAQQTVLFVGLAILIGLGAAAGGRSVALAAMLENWLLDMRLGLTAPVRTTDSRIAIVAVTEDTLATLPYRHPIDRRLLAGIVDKADRAGARAVGFDILFDQATEPAKDAAFEDAVARAGVPVTVGYADRRDGLTERQVDFIGAFAPAAARAYVNLVRDDRDGTVRSTLAGRGEGEARIPGLATALSGTGEETQRSIIRLTRSSSGDRSPFPVWPAHAFHLIPDAWIEGRTLLVGADLPHQDRYPTALVALEGLERGILPGVEIHAHALADLLDGEPVRRSGFATDTLLASLLAGLGLLAGAWSGRLGFKLAGLSGVALAFWVAGTQAVASAGLAIPLFMPTMAMLTGSGVGAALSGRRHRAEKRFIRNAMSRYVAPAVVADLQRYPEKLKLGGERREVTLLFTDIAGFTSTSEATAPEILVPVLNAYLDGMSRIVIEHGGTLDKFIGDALVAIFGAPLDQPDHAARAVACARAMARFAETFSSIGEGRRIALGRTRIGVHSGAAIIGNIGGEDRFDYTAIGDTVNTAARLEGANKYFGTQVCISADTARAAGADDLCPVGDVVLKGRQAALRVYTFSGSRAYRRAFAALERGDVEKARAELISAGNEEEPGELVRFHLSRIERGDAGIRILLEEK